jgi:hypothetical protein
VCVCDFIDCTLVVIDLHVRVARALPPCLPAHLLFMAIRLYDRDHNDLVLMNTFHGAHLAIQQRIQVCYFYYWHVIFLLFYRRQKIWTCYHYGWQIHGVY